MENQNAKILNMQNSQGKTALHFACAEGHDSTAEELLMLGAVIQRCFNTSISFSLVTADFYSILIYKKICFHMCYHKM